MSDVSIKTKSLHTSLCPGAVTSSFIRSSQDVIKEVQIWTRTLNVDEVKELSDALKECRVLEKIGMGNVSCPDVGK